MLPPSMMPANPENYIGYWIGKGMVYGLISGFAIGIAHKIIMFLIGGGV